MRIGECMFFSRCFDLGALLLDLLLDDELVLVEGFLDLAIGHLSILHFKLKLIFECVNLFCEYSAYGFLPLVYVIISDSVHDHLFELGELTGALGSHLFGHLLVVVFQLADLFQISHVEVDLLLVLLFKSLLLRLNIIDDVFAALPHGHFNFLAQQLPFVF